jgi:hypothetical protein
MARSWPASARNRTGSAQQSLHTNREDSCHETNPSKFRSVTLQTWQAEYLVIALYVVLTIFLRQQDSPESKPVESSNATTGEANK